jgi:hypothetical protein
VLYVNKMAEKVKEKQYLSLKALFESGSVKRMKDIEKLFPTMVAKDLGMNHSRYTNKLFKPEQFTFKQILKFSILLDVNPKLLSDIILAELLLKSKPKRPR